MQNNPTRVRWDLFVSNTGSTKGALSSRPSLTRNRQKTLPPVRTSNSTRRTSQGSGRQIPVKAIALPPIENNRTVAANLPIVFILSKYAPLEKNKDDRFLGRFIQFDKPMFKINGTLQSYYLFAY